jgi:hypothetical protein
MPLTVGGSGGVANLENAADGSVKVVNSKALATDVGSHIVQYVEMDGVVLSAAIEVRDTDVAVTNPYAQMTWGFGNNDAADGFVQVDIANDDGTTLVPVFRADLDGTQVSAIQSSGATLDLHANHGIRFYATGSSDYNWAVTNIGVLFPYPGAGLVLPTKAGVLDDTDYAFGIDGMTGVNTAANRFMFRSGDAWFYVAGTPV